MASVVLGSSACRGTGDVQVLPESARLDRKDPSDEDSVLFDGKVVRLRAGRGETVGFQVRGPAGRFESFELRLPGAAADVAVFSIQSLTVREPSSDMYGPSTGSGDYSDILIPASQPLTAARRAYFDVTIPSGAAPGRYSGSLGVGTRSIPVIVDVSRARIDVRERPLVWVFYSPSDVAFASGVPDDDSPALIEKEAAYDALFRAHGAYLASDLPPERFASRRRFVHDVSYWPVAFDTRTDESIERDVDSWLELFAGDSVVPFAIPVDEPRHQRQKDRARHIAEVAGRAGAGERLLRAVTDSASESYGDAMDVFISPKSIPRAEPRAVEPPHLWTYNGRPPEAGSMVLDTAGAALRTWGWIAERYGVELWYAWEGLYFRDRYNHGGQTDVTREPITFDERRNGGTDWGNGDGVLAYPGPLPSLRLKVLRRGLEDRLLLRALRDCGGAAAERSIVQETIPAALGDAGDEPSWPASAAGWERARRAVLDAIDTECHDHAELD